MAVLRSATVRPQPSYRRRPIHSLQTINLQWSTGAFCVAFGALMLVAPHQFVEPAYAPLQPALSAWGILFLLTGLGLAAVTVLAPPHGLALAINMLACTVLLTLAAGFAAAGSWTGTINYTLLGLSLALAAMLRTPAETAAGGLGNDLLVMVLGVNQVLSGLVVLLLPGEVSSAVYVSAWPALGLALLIGGAVVLLLQRLEWHAGAPRWVKLLGHLLAASSYLVFLAGVVLPAQAWVSILYYGGFALFLAVVPLLEPRLSRLRPAMLQARVALLLVSVVTVPSILCLALMSNQIERAMRREALDREAQLAQGVAQSLAEYVGLHQATLTVLASHPGVLEMPHEGQTALLEAFHRAYPEVAAFALYDTEGRRVAVSTGAGFGSSLATQPLFESARQTGQPSLAMATWPGLAEPVFGFGVPVYDAAGEFRGLMTMGLQTARVVQLLASEGTGPEGEITLVNEVGQPILGAALSESGLATAIPVGSNGLPVAEARAHPGTVGSFRYAVTGDEQLVGYAHVPGLSWLVVVERPASSALAGVHSSRDLAFGILLVALLLTGASGVVLAGWVTAPLKSLAQLALELAGGRSQSPLPRSEIEEVAQLAQAFGEMRGRLAARTTERELAQANLERSEAELRQLSARLQESQEQERQRIAREVHDELGGTLTGLKMDTAYLSRHWGDADPELQQKLDAMAQLLDETVRTVRRIATDLRPAMLDDFGLLPALEWQLQVFGQRAGIECRLACGVEGVDLDRDSALAVFRVFQETLTNIARHAQATRVEVDVAVQEDRLVLRVADNGIGLKERPAAAAGPRSLGLVVMRERVQALRGHLEVQSAGGQGTTVKVVVPLSASLNPGRPAHRAAY